MSLRTLQLFALVRSLSRTACACAAFCVCCSEQVAYQLKCGVNDKVCSGMIALTKVQATKVFDLCARESTQILGGAACVRGGPGEKVERLYREVRVNAIAGGSEEVLMDLSMRMAKL